MSEEVKKKNFSDVCSADTLLTRYTRDQIYKLMSFRGQPSAARRNLNLRKTPNNSKSIFYKDEIPTLCASRFALNDNRGVISASTVGLCDFARWGKE